MGWWLGFLGARFMFGLGVVCACIAISVNSVGSMVLVCILPNLLVLCGFDLVVDCRLVICLFC